MIDATPHSDWRLFPVALLDDPRYLAMSPIARLLLVTVRLRLGPLGIAAVPGASAVFAELLGVEPDDVDRSREELVAHRWLEVAGSIWWLRDGLRHETHLSARNRNHVAFVRKLIGCLPRVAIVNDFVAAFPDWFGDSGKPIDRDGDGIRMPFNTHSNGIRKPLEGHSNGLPITDTYTETDTQTETPTEPAAADAAAAPAAAGKSEPPAEAQAALAVDLPKRLETQFPEAADREVVAGFLARLSSESANAWGCRFANWLRGVDFPGRATPAAIVTAIRDLEPNEIPSPRKVRRFAEKAGDDHIAAASTASGDRSRYRPSFRGRGEPTKLRELAPSDRLRDIADDLAPSDRLPRIQ